MSSINRQNQVFVCNFYDACRNGKIDEVREQLPNMSLEEIDRVQPNGSTGLHAACFYGHKEIVKLLLDKGASRLVMNKHKNLSCNEAESDELKALFRRQSAARFADDGSGHIDWMKCDASAEKLARQYRFRHSGFGWSSQNIDYRMKYSRINPAFEQLSYKGKVYRGMSITQDDLKQYSVGGKVMNKAFMSTTKDRSVAKEFATKSASDRTKQHGELVRLSAFCTYEIINNRTGLSIENISEYSHEKEVLVGPYSAFTIESIRQIRPDYVEIDLRECEQAPNEEEDDSDDDDDDY